MLISDSGGSEEPAVDDASLVLWHTSQRGRCPAVCLFNTAGDQQKYGELPLSDCTLPKHNKQKQSEQCCHKSNACRTT